MKTETNRSIALTSFPRCSLGRFPSGLRSLASLTSLGFLSLTQAAEALPLQGDTLSVAAKGSAPAVQTGLQVEPNGSLWAGSGTGYDSTSATPTGEGTRLMWLPEKNAFRAGRILGEQADLWDYANLGEHSFAWGWNNLADGYAATAWGAFNQVGDVYATAWGAGNSAQGYAATTWGRENFAAADQATAFGYYTEATGLCATSWGRHGSATGDYATSWGERSHAAAYLSTVFGRDNIGGFTDQPDGPDGDTQWFDSDPLLEVGAGDWQDGQANVFSLMKDGSAAIGIHRAHPQGDETLVVHGALQLGDYAEPETASPAAGALRFTGSGFEGFDGSAWHSLSEGGTATGSSALVDPGAPEITVLEVASGGGRVIVAADLEIAGALRLAGPQGDLSMGVFTAP